MTLVEKVARAICAAEGIDPDGMGWGMGVRMPLGQQYRLWEVRVKEAQAAIKVMEE